MRLRTIPVSIAGVLAGTGCAVVNDGFYWPTMAICLLFAVIAQIASNFANEYYDWRNGLDRKGREGFRRGVTEGDIKPQAMKMATYLLIILDSLLGCSLIYWGGWWLIAVGIAVAVFAVAYSAGPCPLSHHGLGDVAVVIFFGLVPVTLSCYLQVLPATGSCTLGLYDWLCALGVGLMAANVLIVNNCRDIEDDRAVGKRTTAVIWGRKAMQRVYLIGAVAGPPLMCAQFLFRHAAAWVIFSMWGYRMYRELAATEGRGLNGVLKHTAQFLLVNAVVFLAVCCIVHFYGD